MKSAQVKVKLGELKALLEEYLQDTMGCMKYGCKTMVIGKSKWWCFKQYRQTPYDDPWEYWRECVQHYYPWNELRGILEAFEMLSPDTEVFVSSRVFDEMFLG